MGGAQALSARARQLTPQAYERDVFSLPRHQSLLAVVVCALMLGLACAGTAFARGNPSGGAAFVPPPPPPQKATVVAGRAIAPAGAPDRVKRVIEAGNQIIGKPYKYGGGHKTLASTSRRRALRLDSGYDCSGSISHALGGGRFLRAPLNSTGFMSWGQEGPGSWITVYAHGGHAYLVVAGLRLDTSLREDPSRTGPQWSKRLRVQSSFQARHPRGF
jgi:cell wall-associated NlpC family hydrolase